MIVIYRFSDKGYPKNKPDYVTKRGCILHALRIFSGHPFYVIADNTSDESYAFLMEHVSDSTNKVIRTTLSNAGAYMYAVKFAIDTFRDDDMVYLAEDDYIYTPDAPGILVEGIAISDYVSGYDHPDKYVNHNEGGAQSVYSRRWRSDPGAVDGESPLETHQQLLHDVCV